MEFVPGPTLSSYLPQIQMDRESLKVLVCISLTSFYLIMADGFLPAMSKADSFPSCCQSHEICGCSSRRLALGPSHLLHSAGRKGSTGYRADRFRVCPAA